MTERDTLRAILWTLGQRSDLRIWRANAGVARIDGRIIRFGMPGQADLTGILADGRRLEIEVKSKAGRQSKAQKLFQYAIERMNGVYIIARSVGDAEAGIANAMRYNTIH